MSDIFTAFAGGHGPDPASGVTEDPDTVADLIDIAELIGVMRGPIAWVFTLAERRADGDAVDLAAIYRVRDAALHRLDAIVAGALPADPPRIRAADVVTVASLLVGAIDPTIVQRAAQIVGGGISDALSAILPLAPTIASEFMSTPHACGVPPAWGAPPPSSPVAPPWPPDYRPRVAVPFADLFGAPLGHSHAPRPAVPHWHWLHTLLGF